jgi:hypothetical protein
MTRINNLTRVLLPLSLMAVGLTAQDMPAPQPQQQSAPASPRDAMMARRQVMQRLSADFRTAVQNGGLSADDKQKAEAALAQIQPRTKGNKGAPADPQARHAAMQTVQQMSANPALRSEDRQVLAKDLADLQALRHRKS